MIELKSNGLFQYGQASEVLAYIDTIDTSKNSDNEGFSLNFQKLTIAGLFHTEYRVVLQKCQEKGQNGIK